MEIIPEKQVSHIRCPHQIKADRMNSLARKTKLALFQDHFGLMYDAAERFSKKCPGVERQVLPSGCIRCCGATAP